MNDHWLWLAGGLGVLFSLALIVASTVGILGEQRFSEGLSTQREFANRLAEMPAGELTVDGSLSQTFLARRPGLAAVDIQLVTFQRQNDPDLVFTVSEESRPQKMLHTVVVDADQVLDNRFFRFEFPPISQSEGRRYVARLESPDGRPGNAFSAWVGACACYDEGMLFVDGGPRPDEDLAMQIVYSTGSAPVGEELVNRLSQYKPFFFKGIALVTLGLISLALASASFGGMATGVVPGSPPDDYRWRWVLASVIALAVLLFLWKS